MMFEMSEDESESGTAAAPAEEAASNSNDNDGEEEGPSETKPSFCSMCWRGDKEEGAGRLLTCRDCGVHYHNLCYRGISSNFDDDNELCLACAAVGTTVTGRTRSGTHHTMGITSRPYECCLCSVNDPNLPLAMHPIYDRNHGRQLILEGKSESDRRLAWCHTLCARVVNAYRFTGGCVYSCDQEGLYAEHEEDDDDRSIGSGIQQARDQIEEGKEKGSNGVHHYVIVIAPQYKEYTDAIKKHQKFKCQECFHKDTPANVFRIPIPCMCREAAEPKDYGACHQKRDKECLNALHVGCALWGKHLNGKQQWPTSRRVHFEPNAESDFCLLYCNRHAKNIKNSGPKKGIVGSDWMRYPDIDNAQVGGDKPPAPAANADAAIRSDDGGEFGDFEGDAESSDDDLDADTEDEDDSEENGDGVRRGDQRNDSNVAKKRKRKEKKAKRKRKKNLSVLGKAGGKARGHKHEETAKERLEKKMSKRKNQSSSGATSGGGGGAPPATRGERQTTYEEVRPIRVNKPSVLLKATASDDEHRENAVAVPEKKKKSKPRSLKSYIGMEKKEEPKPQQRKMLATKAAPGSSTTKTKTFASAPLPYRGLTKKAVPSKAKSIPEKSSRPKDTTGRVSGSDSDLEDLFSCGDAPSLFPKPVEPFQAAAPRDDLSDGEISEDLFRPGLL